MRADTGGVEVGVAGGRIDGVLLKVLTDVLSCGLRQQPVDALPVAYNIRNTCVNVTSPIQHGCRGKGLFLITLPKK